MLFGVFLTAFMETAARMFGKFAVPTSQRISSAHSKPQKLMTKMCGQTKLFVDTQNLNHNPPTLKLTLGLLALKSLEDSLKVEGRSDLLNGN